MSPRQVLPRAAGILMAMAALVAGCATAAPPGVPAGPGAHPLEGRIFETATGGEVTAEELVERLAGSDAAILGEVHDNPVHHARQAWLIERLAPAGVAFEMVPEASEKGIRVFRAQGGAAGDIGPAIGWSRLGWPEWEIYRPVFEAAGEAYIAGAGVATPEILRSMGEGAAAAWGAGAASVGLDQPLPEAEQEAAEAEMVAAHCDMLPARAAPGMVEAQRLRDASFARATLRAAGEDGGLAVLVTGNGHARTDRGVPVYLARLRDGLAVHALGQVEVRPGADTLAAYGELPYDFVWFSKGVEDRPDPCEAFRDRG